MKLKTLAHLQRLRTCIMAYNFTTQLLKNLKAPKIKQQMHFPIISQNMRFLQSSSLEMQVPGCDGKWLLIRSWKSLCNFAKLHLSLAMYWPGIEQDVETFIPRVLYCQDHLPSDVQESIIYVNQSQRGHSNRSLLIMGHTEADKNS